MSLTKVSLASDIADYYDLGTCNTGVTIEASETLTSSSVGLGSLAEKVEGEMKYSTTGKGA